MYNTHRTAVGKTIPIIQLFDSHLINILKLRTKGCNLTSIQKKFVNNQITDPSDVFQQSINYFFEGLRRDTTREETQEILLKLFPDVEKAKRTVVFADNLIDSTLLDKENSHYLEVFEDDFDY